MVYGHKRKWSLLFTRQTAEGFDSLEIRQVMAQLHFDRISRFVEILQAKESVLSPSFRISL